MPNAIEFIITFDVKPNRTADFKTMLAAVQTELPQVEGCNGVRIFHHEDAEQPTFTLLESWDDKSLHQAHVARLQESGDWAAIEAMLAAPPQGHYLTAI